MEILDPGREIVDPHHHLWSDAERGDYVLDDLYADTCTGHHVVQTMFVECSAGYRTTGPEHLRPVGETEWVAGVARASAAGPGPEIVGSAPDTRVILDHFGTPVGVGRYRAQRAEIFAQSKRDMAAAASLPNVVAKLGGLAMSDNGFGWDQRATPVTAEEFAAAQRDYYLHAIDCFGTERCMFESNFPVEKVSVSYPVLYNAFKLMTADFSEADKNALFSATARRVYSLPEAGARG